MNYFSPFHNFLSNYNESKIQNAPALYFSERKPYLELSVINGKTIEDLIFLAAASQALSNVQKKTPV